MTDDLKAYSDQQLREELLRRRNSNPVTGQGSWYFMKGDEDFGEEYSSFWIVHKRLWHLNHCMDDNHIDGFVSLPGDFAEEMESAFSYGGPYDEGKKLLLQAGLTELENPFRESLIVYCPLVRSGWPRMDIHCDTPQIKELLYQWASTNLPQRSESLPADWKKDAYLGKVDEFAKPHDLVSIVTSDFGVDRENVWKGGELSVLSRALYESLPPMYERT